MVTIEEIRKGVNNFLDVVEEIESGIMAGVEEVKQEQKESVKTSVYNFLEQKESVMTSVYNFLETNEGWGLMEAANHFGVHPQTLYDHLTEEQKVELARLRRESLAGPNPLNDEEYCSKHPDIELEQGICPKCEEIMDKVREIIEGDGKPVMLNGLERCMG